jgi:hypothetical protein
MQIWLFSYFFELLFSNFLSTYIYVIDVHIQTHIVYIEDTGLNQSLQRNDPTNWFELV